MENELSTYRVEVSGWDINESFFVERAALEWGASEQRTVVIRQRVRAGALVFLRLLHDATPARCFPVAYRARQVVEREGGALFELALSQVWPAPENASLGATVMLDAAGVRSLGVN